jgi:hypothetical protein
MRLARTIGLLRESHSDKANRMGKALLAMLLLFASVAAPARAQRPSHYHSATHSHSRCRSYSTHEAYPHRAQSHSSRGHHVPSSATSHSHRSVAAKDAFKREQPCPSTGRSSGTCPGYVIDHVEPLACGGADAPSNMQWQTNADGKAKDKWERRGCN